MVSDTQFLQPLNSLIGKGIKYAIWWPLMFQIKTSQDVKVFRTLCASIQLSACGFSVQAVFKWYRPSWSGMQLVWSKAGVMQWVQCVTQSRHATSIVSTVCVIESVRRERSQLKESTGQTIPLENYDISIINHYCPFKQVEKSYS